MEKKITPDKVLQDPEFYELPEWERIKVLKTIDPSFSFLPAVEQLKVVKAYEGKFTNGVSEKFANGVNEKEDAPFYEKAWRQFAHGSGEIPKTIGGIIENVAGGLFNGPMGIQAKEYVKPVSQTLKDIGTETQKYWQADEDKYKFHGLTGEITNTLLRETPSLIALSPAMKLTGKMAITTLSPKGRVAKSITESVGTGVGYTGANLAGREGYDVKEAGVDTLIDFTFGAGSPYAGKVIRKVSEAVQPLFDRVGNEIKDLLHIARNTKDKTIREPVKKIVKTARKNDTEELLKVTDEVLNSENIPPGIKEKAVKIQKKIKQEDDLPEPVKEGAAETADSYLDIETSKPNVGLELTSADIKELKRDLEGFQAQLNLFKQNNMPPNELIKIGKPKKILKEIGFPDIDITINPKVLRKKIKKHELSFEDIKDLPEQINNPVIVYKLPDKENIIVTTAKVKDNGILLTVIKVNAEKSQLGRGTKVNDIRSIYFKDAEKFINHLNILQQEGEVWFVNKKKISDLLTKVAKRLSASGGTIPPRGQPLIDNISKRSKYVKLYAGVPFGKVFEGMDYIERKLLSALKGNEKIGFWDETFNDPEEVFKNMGKEKYYNLVKKAFDRQARLEKGYKKIIGRIRENLKTDADKELFENILHVRDKFKVEKIEDIEKILGRPLPENIKRAYRAFDTGMKWASKLLELDKRILVNKLYKEVEPISVKGFKESNKIPAIELEQKFNAMLKAKNFQNPKMKDLAKRLEANPIVYGYVPHVFNSYYVTDRYGNILATFKKEVEAEKFIKANPDIAKPKVNQFKFKIVNAEDLENPEKFREALKERIQRLSYHRYIGFKEKRKGVGGWENFPYLVYDNEGKVIGRYKTKEPAVEFANKHNGQLIELKDLPKKDLVSDIEWYLHKVARYRAMEDIKPKLVTWFINDYGLKVPKNTPIEQLKQAISQIQDPRKQAEARYIAEFINDVLGRPRGSEEYVNRIFKKHPKIKRIAERLGLAYGDRAGLVALNKTHKFLAHNFLGFFKPAMFVVQLSTIPSNTWVLLAKQIADGGKNFDLTRASYYVAKAMYTFATNKNARALAWRVVSDAPTVAEINQYTGKTFAKGILENLSLAPLTIGDRIARSIAFLAKYEQLKASGYKGNKARIAKEFALQTNFNMKVYDTPPALRNPLIRFYMMFKPFLIKELNFLKRLPWKYRIAGSTMLATFLGTHAFFLYELGEWTGLNDKIYELIGKPLEEAISEVSGISREKLAEVREYGIIGALTGLSLYQNMGLGDIIGGITGSSAPVQYFTNMYKAGERLIKGDTERAKEYASKLLPSYLRKIKDAMDILSDGYIYRNGKPVIRGTTKDAVALLLGVTPVHLQKFYNMKQELKSAKDERRIKRDKLMKELYEASVRNDTDRMNEIAKQMIEEKLYPNAQALRQAFKAYIYSIKVPKELQLYAKPETRQLLMKKPKSEVREIYNRLMKEYQSETDPIVKKAYESAIKNIKTIIE